MPGIIAGDNRKSKPILSIRRWYARTVVCDTVLGRTAAVLCRLPQPRRDFLNEQIQRAVGAGGRDVAADIGFDNNAG